MRELPRLPDGASADEKIRIIYDWLYELQMAMKEILRPRDFDAKSLKAQNDNDEAAEQNNLTGVSE